MIRDDLPEAPVPSAAHDPDRAAILARRQSLLAVALSGLTAGVGCAPCLKVGVPSEQHSSEGGGEATSGAPTTSTGESSGSTTGGTIGSTTGETTGAPIAGLRLNHLQALGTHNSYHVSSGSSVKDLDYTHRPLAEQLDGGVRKFELDVHFGDPGAPIAVYHLELLDEMTTCATLGACLQALRGWSDAHPGHHLLYVMIEVKTAFNQIMADAWLADLEQQILAVWPRERVLTPDDVQGDAPDLPTAIATRGWPSIDATRGKLLLVLHDGESWRARYVQAGTAGKLLFPDAFGDLTLPYAAVHSINDPIADADEIAAIVDAGHLVRTRADADNVEPFADDHTRAEAALASGATFISTDYPAPKGELEYFVEIPGGDPSRCNPRVAPDDCTAQQIEDL
ncbi:MAG: hypothetical protein JNL82_03330 [Myxococcales bacterium]|nr:hypothetical protein [Myxococcales bacterium]